MIFATTLAVILVFAIDDESVKTAVLDGFTVKLLIAVSGTTLVWLAATFLIRPEKKEVLYSFYENTHPGGPGWKRIIRMAKEDGRNINVAEEGKRWEMPLQLLLVFLGLIAIYGALFSIGSFVYSNIWPGLIAGAIAVVSTVVLFMLMSRLRVDKSPGQ